MDVALCYPKVVPGRGGCETYLGDLSRRLSRDGHGVHLYASNWDAAALPAAMHYHRVDASGPRWLRPWRFAENCLKALERDRPDVSIGFDKSFGQDILYPQGGLHAGTAAHNMRKSPSPAGRLFAKLGKAFDAAHWSYSRLEKKQYFGERRPLVIVNSDMVRCHFEEYYGVPGDTIRVLHSAIDPNRFSAGDRFPRRHEERARWGVAPDTPVGLFAAMNYRLKGLEPLLRALPENTHLAVVGHPKFEAYQALARKLGIGERVHFLSHRPDPRDAFFAADFLVHPTFYDPCSLVVLEAMACGLPVVTTRYNGAKELLTESFGVVIDDPHNRGELSAAIRRVRDPLYRTIAASAARAAAAKWTFEHHYRELVNILSERMQLRRAA